MGLLGRERQIDGIGEAGIQNINGNGFAFEVRSFLVLCGKWLRVRGEIIPCLMRFHAGFSTASLARQKLAIPLTGRNRRLDLWRA
jgi:hypothetical protein